MDHRRQATFFAITSPGLERLCAAELASLKMADVASVEGGVLFSGRLEDLYRANLWLRTASRIVVRMASLQSRSFPDLYRKAVRLPWGRFIRPGTEIDFRVTARRSRLMHSGRIRETLQAACSQALGGGECVAVAAERQMVLVRIVDDEMVLSVDSSGELLHRRGYRRSVTPAPLRETLAAGVLLSLGWQGQVPLADPMCGTGSFLLEGGLLSRHVAPGLGRSAFAFMHWPGFREGLWGHLCQEAERQVRPQGVALLGSDQDLQAITAARANCAALDLEVSLQHQPLASLGEQPGPGLVVCNPPYGKRLQTDEPLTSFYAGLGRELGRVFPGWRKALICPDPVLAEATGLSLQRVALLDNGGLEVGLFATG